MHRHDQGIEQNIVLETTCLYSGSSLKIIDSEILLALWIHLDSLVIYTHSSTLLDIYPHHFTFTSLRSFLVFYIFPSLTLTLSFHWHNSATFLSPHILFMLKTLRTGDADLRFYTTTVQDGWRKSAFLTRACFPCTVHVIMQYIEPVSEWSCWRMFIETWPHSELTFRHRASSI